MSAAAAGRGMPSQHSQELEDELLWSDDGADAGADSESEEPETSGAAAALPPLGKSGGAAPPGLDIAGW